MISAIIPIVLSHAGFLSMILSPPITTPCLAEGLQPHDLQPDSEVQQLIETTVRAELALRLGGPFTENQEAKLRSFTELRHLAQSQPELLSQQFIWYLWRYATRRRLTQSQVGEGYGHYSVGLTYLNRLDINKEDRLRAIVPFLHVYLDFRVQEDAPVAFNAEYADDIQRMRDFFPHYMLHLDRGPRDEKTNEYPRIHDFTLCESFLKSVREDEKVDAKPLIFYMLIEDPLLTLGVLNRVYGETEAERKEVEKLRKRMVGLIEGGSYEGPVHDGLVPRERPPVVKALKELSAHHSWWVRLIAADLERRYPEVRQTDIVEVLKKDSNPLVQCVASWPPHNYDWQSVTNAQRPNRFLYALWVCWRSFVRLFH